MPARILRDADTLVVWLRMIDRCYDPENIRYQHFGGRGVRVCARWHDYNLFIADMGLRPGDRTLERINYKGHYAPNNCRWSLIRETNQENKDRTLAVWNAMIARCTNPLSAAYKDYGGRGIKVGMRWRKYENFLADMGPAPDGLTLERINNSKGYNPKNCIWATIKVQAINKRSRMRKWKHPSGVPHDRKELFSLLRASAPKKRTRKR